MGGVPPCGPAPAPRRLVAHELNWLPLPTFGAKFAGMAFIVHLSASVVFVSCRSSMNTSVSEETEVGVIASGVLLRPPASALTAT